MAKQSFSSQDRLRETPTYALPEAALYLRLPRATVRAWSLGQQYRVGKEIRLFRPIVEAPKVGNRPLLSFASLVELHVLGALRRHHGLSLQKIRQALDYLRRRYPRTRHPLADHDLLTDGLDLWVRELDALVAASRHGQLGIREALEAHLRRVDRSPSGLALRLYPFTRAAEPDEPRAVVIDPAVAFGRPTLVGTGIPTAVIGDRYKAGESIEELAEDYHRSPEEINEAIRCELWTRAA